MDLRLTKENLWNTLDENMLNRNTEVKEFVQMLDKCEADRIFAINGDWGCGKTFFIRQVCEVLDLDYQRKKGSYLNGNKDFDRIEKIVAMHEELQVGPLNRDFVTLYYDAWLHDDHEDPLLSLIYEIESKYKEMKETKEPKNKSFKDILNTLKDDIESKKGLQNIIEVEKLKKNYRDLLGELLHQKGLGEGGNGHILIVIDELDRCKPDYAVKVLERIKHFVELENVFFVYCLNKVELCKSIECFYGRKLKSTVYLNKFFDITYDLNIKDISLYYLQIAGVMKNNPKLNPLIPSLPQYLNFSLRECNQFREVMRGCLLIEEAGDEIFLISKNIFYPIIAALRISNAQKCRDFLNGRLREYVEKIYNEVEDIKDVLKERSLKNLLSAYDILFNSEDGGNDVKKMRSILKDLLYDRGKV